MLSGLSEVDMREVLLAAVAAETGASGERVAMTWMAIARWLAETGQSTKGEYVAWRERADRPDEWPSADEIVNAFGSWPDALRAARVGGVQVDVSAQRILASGSQFSAEELVECVRDWLQSERPERPSIHRYVAWARAQMTDPHRRRPRYFRSAMLLYEHFSGWPELLAAAGGAWVARAPDEEAQCASAKLWIDRYRAEHDGALPSSHDLQRFLVAARAAGEEGWLPWPASLAASFGSWPAALARLGYIDEREARARVARRGRSEQELLGFVVEALGAIGDAGSSTKYSAWAAGQRRSGRLEVPTFPALYSRLGSWASIRRAAIELRDREAR